MTSPRDLTFRQSLLTPLFAAIRAGESSAVVGVSSVGKTRLLDFLFHTDVQQHYLGDAANTLRFVRTDANRAAALSEWGLYELLLTVLVEAVSGLPDKATAESLQQRLTSLRTEVILHKDALLAQRHLETAALIVCAEHGLRLAIVLDEFDDFYTKLPAPALANLRGLRDLVKPHNYGISYVLMMRHDPARLRDPDECEGFYELLSRHVLGLRPYTRSDALGVLEHAQKRRNLVLPNDTRERILTQSGGHGGIIDALVSSADQDQTAGLAGPVIEECRKIWGSLADDERILLSQQAAGIPIPANDLARASLLLKGILLEDHLFSSLFSEYIAKYCTASNHKLWLDESQHAVWIGDHMVGNLSAKEFNLLKLLYIHAGEVVTRDDVIQILYPGEESSASESEDNRLDAFIRRLRSKIEPAPSHPIYLITKLGVGYKLLIN